MSLQGKSAVITGSGRGIGRAIALEYARQGASVALAARTGPQLEETMKLISNEGGKAIKVETDVTDRSSIERLLQAARSAFGSVDILINNAGSFRAIGPVQEVDPQLWWQDVTVNLLGTFLCCRAVLPEMLERKEGIIINLIGGGTGGPFAYGTGYGSSKAAIMRFTESLAVEVRDKGIAVFPMGPGLVRTAMTEYQMETKEGRKWLPGIVESLSNNRTRPPEDAARLAAALGSGEFDEFSGRAFNAGDDLAEVLRRKSEILESKERTLRLI